MVQISKIELMILLRIKARGFASVDELKNDLPQIEVIETYIHQLFTTTTRRALITEVCNNNDRTTPKYKLTDLGIKALQDHLQQQRSDNKELWLKNAWIPIIVAFVTTLLTNHLLPQLWTILKRLFHIP